MQIRLEELAVLRYKLFVWLMHVLQIATRQAVAGPALAAIRHFRSAPASQAAGMVCRCVCDEYASTVT